MWFLSLFRFERGKELVSKSIKEAVNMRGFFGILSLCLVLLVAGVGAQAALVVDTPGLGTGVSITGSGAPAHGFVEVFVNGITRGSAYADHDGKWSLDGVNLAAGDKVFATCSVAWNFNTDFDTEGWQGIMCTLDVQGGILKMTIDDDSDPQIYLSTPNIPPANYRILQMRVKNPTSFLAMQVFFNNGNGYREEDSNATPWKQFKDQFDTLNFGLDMKLNESFVNSSSYATGGPIKDIRIDPFGGSGNVGQTIEIDFIRLSEYIAFEFNNNGEFNYLFNEHPQLFDIDPASFQVNNGRLNMTVRDVNDGSAAPDSVFDPSFNTGGPLGDVLDWQINSDHFTHMDIGGQWNAAVNPNNYDMFWSDNRAAYTDPPFLDGWAVNGNNARSADFTMDNSYQNVSFDITNSPEAATWGGADGPVWFNPLRIDPIQTGSDGDTVSIDYIRIRPANPFGPSPEVTVSNTAGSKNKNLVKNGSFEAGGIPNPWPYYCNIPYWTKTSGGGVNDKLGPFWDNGYKMHGKQVAFCQGSQILSQEVFGFVSGQQYTLRFLEDLRNSSLEVDLVVRLNGTDIVNAHRVPFGEFALVSADFMSPGNGNFLLEFEAFVSGDGTLLLDGISIVPQGEANPFPPATLPPRPPGLIINGSFEDEPINPQWPHYGPVIWWTGLSGMNDNTGPFWDNGILVHGDQVAFKQNPGVVSQEGVGFVAGQEYTLRFRENARNCCPPEAPAHPELEVKLNGVTLVPNHEVIPGEFQPFAIDFMSPGNGNYLLEFIVGAPGGDSTLLLDAVSIVPKGQPDPFPAIPICWPIHVYKTPAPPTIDGVINVASEYPASRVQPVDLRLSTLAATDPYDPACKHAGSHFEAGGQVENDADNSALIYFSWDNQALYVAVDGKDESMNPVQNGCGTYACGGAGVNQGDTFQLCLDYDQGEATDGQVVGAKVYIPSWALTDNADDPNWFQQFWPVDNPNPFTGMTYNMKTNANGYVLEARIPWTAFTSGGDTYTQPFPPAEGQTCGVLPMLEDNDGGAVSFLYTAGNNTNIIINASEYNDLIFHTSTTSVEDWSQY